MLINPAISLLLFLMKFLTVKWAVSEFQNKELKMTFSLAIIDLKIPDCNTTGNRQLNSETERVFDWYRFNKTI